MHYYAYTDTTSFQIKGVAEYHLLLEHPAEYFINIFHSNHNNSYSGFLESSDSYWNDTRSNLLIKMLSIFNIFSGTNFFINSLFYNFFIFFGTIGLYKVFIQIFPSYKIVLIICIFLLPSVIYFSSAIHRDGLIYLSLSMTVYHLYFMIKANIFSLKKMLWILIFLSLILLLRNFVLITLLPALIAWIIAEKKPKQTPIIFIITYIIIIILFFSTEFLAPSYNLPAHVSSRQLAFIQLAKNGSSAIITDPLFPNVKSFFNNTPQALNHSLMRPYLTEHRTLLYIPASIEIFFYEIIFLLFIFFKKKNLQPVPLAFFNIFFSITMFLVIGYTIPIIGAIERYRSIYFPFLLIPLFCYTDWERVRKCLI